MTRKKLLVGAAIVVIGAAVAIANLTLARNEGVVVNAESIRARDLEAVVSASGKIQPKRSVNISADTMGRVTNLAVEEGDRVVRDQFLLQIDPRNLQSRVQSGEAGLQAARSSLEQMKRTVETARANLALAKETLRRQQELWEQQLTTRESLDRAENDVRVRELGIRETEQQVRTQDARIRQERAALASAQYDLSKVRIESPIDGIVTRRNIEEGETVVIGTMNNAGTVLLTIADMSVIEAEVEVDETDIPLVRLGQPAKVSIDALPDQTFPGKVTEIGNSPIQTTSTGTAARQATNFKVVVTVEGQIPEVRPGFTCSADITTATRSKALAVPIQATAVREVVFDQDGKIVREPEPDRRRSRTVEPGVGGADLPPGHTRKEIEGVFVIRNDRAVFEAIKTGIAGDKYFEVLEGLKEGDRVVTGPYSSVRELRDAGKVRIETPKP